LDGARLQQSSSQSEDVVLATADALFVIPLDGGQAREHPAGGTGTPTAPAQAQGCAYGAWNGSKRYVRACGDGEPTAEAIPVDPLHSAQTTEEHAGATVPPTAPAQAQGCAYGAWNGSKRYVRACGDGEPTAEAIPESPDDGDLRLRVNNDLVVLNDQEFGLSW